MRLTIKCSIAILENNNQSYLFSKRKKSPYIDYFEFPGGKLKDNEKIFVNNIQNWSYKLSSKKYNFVNAKLDDLLVED